MKVEATRSVSVLITCRNEAAELAGALDALLSQTWRISPQIMVASDASTDATEEIARSYGSRGVSLFRHAPRSGKTLVENAVRGEVRGDIVVFLDAAARPARDSGARVLEAFRDPTVGVVSAREVSTTRGAESAYLCFDELLRELETKCGGIVGASGTFYAIRRELFVELESFAPRDFASVLFAHHRGFRSVSVEAPCAVRPAATLEVERRRRTRTMSQGVATLMRYGAWVHPIAHPGFALKLLGHKVARWLFVPSAVLGSLAALILLSTAESGPMILGAGAVVLVLGVGRELWLTRRGKWVGRWLTSAVVWLAAGAYALTWVMKGRPPGMWEPTRRA